MAECETCKGDPSLCCPDCVTMYCQYCGEILIDDDEYATGWCNYCERNARR